MIQSLSTYVVLNYYKFGFPNRCWTVIDHGLQFIVINIV